jgi:hypothetical protein
VLRHSFHHEQENVFQAGGNDDVQPGDRADVCMGGG